MSKELQTVPLNFRVSKNLRDRFNKAIENNGVQTSEVLRAFMDEYATRFEELQK